jgi:hypothetical protein
MWSLCVRIKLLPIMQDRHKFGTTYVTCQRVVLLKVKGRYTTHVMVSGERSAKCNDNDGGGL